MKRISLFVFSFLWLITFSFGQDLNNSQNVKSYNTIYQISAGVNAVNNLSLRSPLNSPGDWAFETPLAFGIEARSYYNEDLAISIDAAFNKINDLTYYSLDGSVKYYMNEWIPIDNFEFFAQGGLGVFNIDETNVSANAGGGVLYWFNDKFGVRLRSMAKFAFSASENLNTNNHFQHNLELVFVL
jgi:hypothetical protein